MIRTATILVVFLTAATALAQRPLFDPDDFLDPRETGGRPAFVSRIIIGGASNMSGDGFRPLGKQTGYVHLSNSFYWRSIQFDYKRSETRADGGETGLWEYSERRQNQLEQTRNPTPGSKETLQAAWYWPVPAGGGIPVMLRSRLTYSTQTVKNELPTAGGLSEVVSSRERAYALDTDTWFRIAGRDVFGSLAVSRTRAPVLDPNFGELVDRDETAITYTNRFAAFSLDRARVLIRPTLTVGGISNRGGSAVKLVNPAVEIFRPFLRTGANLHIVYSPQWTADGDGWTARHQVAIFIDRALFVKVF